MNSNDFAQYSTTSNRRLDLRDDLADPVGGRRAPQASAAPAVGSGASIAGTGLVCVQTGHQHRPVAPTATVSRSRASSPPLPPLPSRTESLHPVAAPPLRSEVKPVRAAAASGRHPCPYRSAPAGAPNAVRLQGPLLYDHLL